MQYHTQMQQGSNHVVVDLSCFIVIGNICLDIVGNILFGHAAARIRVEQRVDNNTIIKFMRKIWDFETCSTGRMQLCDRRVPATERSSMYATQQLLQSYNV